MSIEKDGKTQKVNKTYIVNGEIYDFNPLRPPSWKKKERGKMKKAKRTNCGPGQIGNPGSGR